MERPRPARKGGWIWSGEARATWWSASRRTSSVWLGRRLHRLPRRDLGPVVAAAAAASCTWWSGGCRCCLGLVRAVAGLAAPGFLQLRFSFQAMEEDKEEGSKKNSGQDNPPETAASLLTDDLILEILSRLPTMSVLRFNCVYLIADPVNRTKLRQTLAGFLYTTQPPVQYGAGSHHFASVSGSAAPFDPSLPFLQPNKYAYISHVDTCNGLLLCGRHSKKGTLAIDTDEFRYVVCNPATERWIELPPPPQVQEHIYHSSTHLAFDPTVSSHFHVLEFGDSILDLGTYVTEVNIFSSQTGVWVHRDSTLVEKIAVVEGYRSVFFGGMLHLVGFNLTSMDLEYALLAVDMEGKVWKTIRLPVGRGAIGLSQGCFYYSSTTPARIDNSTTNSDVRATEITLWCLENYDAKEWVLKHSANIDEPLSMIGGEFSVFAIHPDCDTVFFEQPGSDVLASYDVQHQKLVHILNFEEYSRNYLPYVPLFSEALADAEGQ